MIRAIEFAGEAILYLAALATIPLMGLIVAWALLSPVVVAIAAAGRACRRRRRTACQLRTGGRS